MATIQRFEDIEAQRAARRLTRKVYAVPKRGAFAKGLRPVRSDPKIRHFYHSNIAEGFERDGSKEFINFLSIAKGSAGRCEASVAADEDTSTRVRSTSQKP